MSDFFAMYRDVVTKLQKTQTQPNLFSSANNAAAVDVPVALIPPY
jgi:hypothetical protein